ncbi:MAG: endonuclease, partial [Pseudomonadota bacterium]
AETPAPEPAPAVSVPAATEEPKVAVGQSTPLPGETELAERKGAWRYEGNGADQSATADAAPAEVAGTKPAALDGPRDGKADDLKQIKGVGPKLEKLCNELGFYHFDQVANWTADEVAWVDQNLEGFKGRVSRDDWVSQAKVLASGGTTEFSAKVEKGGVY